MKRSHYFGIALAGALFAFALSPVGAQTAHSSMAAIRALLADTTASNTGAAMVGYKATGTSSTARTVKDKLNDVHTFKDFGATLDGVADDTAELQAALDSGFPIQHGGGGTAKISATLNFDNTQQGITVDFGGLTIQPTAAVAKAISVDGTGDAVFVQNINLRNLVIDMANQNDVSGSIGLHVRNAYNNRFDRIRVIGNGTNKRSLLLEDGAYTTEFSNSDFSSLTGKIELNGVSLSDAVTTILFSSCQFGKATINDAVGITFVNPTVQGTLNKFDLSSINGLTITGGDIEGTGTYLVIGATVGHLTSVNNEFSGFSGTYSSGTAASYTLMDQYGSIAYQFKPNSGFKILDNVLSVVQSGAGLFRNLIESTDATPSAVDLQIKNPNGSTYFGQTAAGVSYVDARGNGTLELQDNGTMRIGWNSADTLTLNTTLAATATAGAGGVLPATVQGYITVVIAGTTRKIPYYAN